MKKLLATLALGLGLVFASGVALAEDAPAKPAAEATAAAPAAAAPAAAEAAPVLVPNKGDTAWMTVATVLVILMTIPGLALFYGGLVRSKNMLSVLMQVFVVSSLIYVLWVIYGYTVAFSGGSPFFGGFDKLFFKGITPDSIAATFSKGVVIPEYLFVVFQATFAAITVALIVGALAASVLVDIPGRIWWTGEPITSSGVRISLFVWCLLNVVAPAFAAFASPHAPFNQGAAQPMQQRTPKRTPPAAVPRT